VEVLDSLWKFDKDSGISNSSGREIVKNQRNGKMQFTNNKPQVET